MKKILGKLAALLLAGCLVFGLAACGDDGDLGIDTADRPVVSELTITVEEGGTYGSVDAWHYLSCDVSNYETVGVYVTKNGNSTKTYEYDAAANKIKFTEAGEYTVIVGAIKGDYTSAASKVITVTGTSSNSGNEGGNEGGSGNEGGNESGSGNEGSTGGNTGGNTGDEGGSGGNTGSTNEITLGSDPFGGTWAELVPDIGMLLYYDATYNGSQVSASSVSYTITSGSNIASINTINSDSNYRYLVATAAGSVTVQMTVSVSGAESKTATKTFTVTSTSDWQTYGQSVYEGALGINLDNDATSGGAAELGRETSVLTKNGIIANRNGSASLDCTLGLIYCGDSTENQQVTFDVTVINNDGNSSGWNTIILDLWQGAAVGSDNTTGNIWVNWNKTDSSGNADKGDIGGGADSAYGSYTESRYGAAANGTTFTIRLTRTVSGSNATLKLEYSADKTNYSTIFSVTNAVSTAAGNAGSPIINVIVHHTDGGIYMISNIQKS